MGHSSSLHSVTTCNCPKQYRADCLCPRRIMYIFRLVVRFFLAEGLSLLLISAAFDNLSKAADNYAGIATPRIEAPIYFYYMDSSKIESLYNQLQPELEIKERETIGKISVKGETKVEANSVRVGVEAGSENQTRSTYAATGFATDRKCLEVMRYVLATWPSNYYTSPDEWMLRRIGQPLMQMYKSLGGLGRFSPLQQTRSPLPDSRDVVAELHSQLRAELQQLRGHLFIDGDFERSVGHGGVV